MDVLPTAAASSCRSYDVEENKRLVLDEVEDLGATPQRLNVWGDGGLGGSPRGGGGVSRARRRTPWAESLVKASPVYYGWVVAGLVTLCALVVSPAQVYSLGVVADAMIADLGLTRLGLSGIYATAALLSAPLITLHPLLLTRFSRRLLVSLTGSGVCLGLLLLSSSAGHVSLLLSFTLLQSVGPGMLYPCAEAVLYDWWLRRRPLVQTLVHAASAAVAMVLLPAILSGCAGCAGCEGAACGCWRGAYSALGAVFVVPVALLSAALLEGGAADHDLALDGEQVTGGLLAAARAAQEASLEAREGREDGEEEEEEDEETRQCTGAAEAAGAGCELAEEASAAAAAASTATASTLQEQQQAQEQARPQPQEQTPPRSGKARRGKGRARRLMMRARRALSQRDAAWAMQDVLTHTTFWLAQVSISTVQAIVAAVLFHRSHLAATHFPEAASSDSPVTRLVTRAMRALLVDDDVTAASSGGSALSPPPPPWMAPPDAALNPSHSLSVELVVGALTLAGSPLHLLVGRKENLMLIAMFLAAAGTLVLANSSSSGGLHFSAMLLGAAFGVTNAYTAVLWEYLYGGTDAHRVRQISTAISTASSGFAVWLFALSFHRNGTYHSALAGSGLLALLLAACDVALLAKPDTIEAIVRRAPTWEQLLAFRQRTGYFSYARRAKKSTARVAARLKAKIGRYAARARSGVGGGGGGGGGGVRMAEPEWVEEEEVRQYWVDHTVEPVHQANPIELSLAEIDPGGANADTSTAPPVPAPIRA